MSRAVTVSASYGVDLFWLPLGAGGRFVRLNGRVYEAIVALPRRRERRDLYHSALIVRVPAGRYVIEQTPIPDGNGHERGVVGEGPVGARWAGRWQHFRYEIRCWRNGVIPDIDEAVASPFHVTGDPRVAQRLLDQVRSAPLAVWGRDEMRTGEMWNSNSLTAWLIVSSGLDASTVPFPAHGRAPGWAAGLEIANRARRPGYACRRV